MSSSKGRCAVGKGLAVGATARLCHLQSAKGKELNEKVVVIVGDISSDGRFAVELIVPTTAEGSDADEKMKKKKSIKPTNLRKVCSSCYKDNANLLVCGHCQVAAYCNRDCQRMHWRKGGHKQVCSNKKKCQDEETDQDIQASTDNQWNASMDHPSWSKFPVSLRKELRQHHLRSGCTVPWPVATETQAMLKGSPPSFLAAHPNMRFHATMDELPGGFQMNYFGQEDHHNINGKEAPMGRVIPMLKEDIWVEDNPREYCRHVPIHAPTPVMYGIVSGSVLWTQYDYEDFHTFFQTQKSLHFDWPGAECVGICPGTGKAVPFSMKTTHLLVVCVLNGSFIRQGCLNNLTRIMPRILTKEGYNKMMGRKGNPNRLVDMEIVRGTTSRRTQSKRIELYPDALRMLGNPDDDSSAGACTLNASKAYNDFHASGRYKAFERWIDDEKSRFLQDAKTMAPGLDVELGPTQSGTGKSNYFSR